ncbi:hypothetical protein BCR35DRAFT_351827 [Leucosporidium creatinivorum]|uniref:F-box domain-containing protein n=1 Tax=Leucosporidium creatinivorum TaxID=106004 RepID=A0A1Y2FL90_9BASI|nr:hypothetical protein BCR35DRAFT_351827 [Leucosporidium creatinivorum]
MAGSRRKITKSAISYQEVDSDIDMQDEDRQVEASKVHTARKKARKTGKKVKQEVEKNKESDAPSLEIFLGAPLDILGEICSHLDPKDLVKLARTSKLFRSLLLSRSSRSIWLAARRAANLPPLEGLNEINYALLLNGTTYMECGSDHHSVQRDFILRTRHCKPCRKLLLTPSDTIKRLGLHPKATACVPATKLGPRRSWRKIYYVTSDLMEVNVTLNELQEDDDIAQDAWMSRRLATGTRTRKPKGTATESPESAEGDLIDETLQSNRRAEILQERRDREAKWQSLKIELEIAEWLEDDIDWYFDHIYRLTHWYSYGGVRYPPLARPLASFPSNDPEGWTDIKEQVEVQREADNTERRANMARHQAEQRKNQRASILRPYYNKMCIHQIGDNLTTFPRFEPFKSFASVKPFWEEEDSTVDDDSWEEALEAIEQEVEAYRIATRVKAITTILAANDDVPLSSLSSDPADYPEDEFGNAFFSKLTSHFYSSSGEGTKTYPDCLEFNRPGFLAPQWGGYGQHELDLTEDLDRRHVCVLRAILAAGNLDEDAATMGDVEALGSTLSWPANPLKFRAQRKHSPTSLMSEVLRRYRSNWKKPFPDLVFKHTPRAPFLPTCAADSDDEDSNDASEMSDDGEDVKPKTRLGKAFKRKQRDSDDDSEEDSNGSDNSDNDEAPSKKRSVKKGVVVKIEDESDGAIDEEESEEGSDQEE